MYAEQSSDAWQYQASQIGSWLHAKRIVETESARTTSRMAVLDVGAFDGQFLSKLVNCRKFAVEPSDEAKQILYKNNVEVIADLIDSPELNDHAASFDVVTLFDVFEHLSAPVQSLEKLLSLLKPGGMLIVSTGNADHWTWKMLKGHHWYMHTIQHLCVGSESYFKAFSRARNLSLESVIRHPHTISPQQRRRDFYETIHYWARLKQSTKLVGLLQLMPGFQYLRHKRGAAFAKSLDDHILVAIRKASN